MEKILLSNKSLKNLKIYSKSKMCSEGKLYQNDKYLYKIFNKEDRDEKEKITDFLMNIGYVENCVMPNSKIYINNIFAGMRMDFYARYKQLYSTLHDESVSYNTRLLICNKLIQAVKKLEEMGICYDDINLYNLLIYNDDLQIVDMDGSAIEGISSKSEYKHAKHLIKCNSIILVFSYLYGTDFEHFIYKYGKEKFKTIIEKLNIDKEIKKFVYATILKKENPVGFINQFFALLNEEEITKDKHNTIVKIMKK
jgi:hypothetical protein